MPSTNDVMAASIGIILSVFRVFIASWRVGYEPQPVWQLHLGNIGRFLNVIIGCSLFLIDHGRSIRMALVSYSYTWIWGTSGLGPSWFYTYDRNERQVAVGYFFTCVLFIGTLFGLVLEDPGDIWENTALTQYETGVFAGSALLSLWSLVSSANDLANFRAADKWGVTYQVISLLPSVTAFIPLSAFGESSDLHIVIISMILSFAFIDGVQLVCIGNMDMHESHESMMKRHELRALDNQ